jgi:uncharacterized membrane-anchored protein YjiN (DUF445 family)
MKATPKQRIPKMSKARIALFALHPWATPEQVKKLHADVSLNHERLLELYGDKKIDKIIGRKSLEFTGNRDHDGNLILASFLENNGPEKQRKEMEAMANRANARSRHMSAFYETFKRQLKDFWQGNQVGFDVCKFDTEIVKSGEDESCKDAIRRQWGEAGLAIILDLMQ